MPRRSWHPRRPHSGNLLDDAPVARAVRTIGSSSPRRFGGLLVATLTWLAFVLPLKGISVSLVSSSARSRMKRTAALVSVGVIATALAIGSPLAASAAGLPVIALSA